MKITFKKLESNRIILKKFSIELIKKEYVSWLNEPINVKYSQQKYKKHTLNSCKKYFKEFTSAGNLFVSVFLKKTKKHIGNLGITIDYNNKIVDVSIIIGDLMYKNKGIGKECWQMIINFLKKQKKIKKISAGTLKCNKNMISLMKNSGMKYDGSRKKHFLVNNTLEDQVFYAIYLN